MLTLNRARRDPGPSDAVQRLVPPVIGGDTEPFHSRGGVQHLRYLLVERQPPNEVFHTLVDRARGVLKGQAVG